MVGDWVHYGMPRSSGEDGREGEVKGGPREVSGGLTRGAQGRRGRRVCRRRSPVTKRIVTLSIVFLVPSVLPTFS